MKRIISILLTLVLALNIAGCAPVAERADEGKLTIVTTIFPEYDWLRNLTAGSDAVELKLLIDKGVDLHSYQPSVRDIVTISTCDVFIYTGGASDSWVKDALETASNEDMVIIDLMELLEEHRELCADDHDHHHDHEEEHHDHTADEHIWLSLVNADHICKGLTELLSELDGDNADLYGANYAEYGAALRELDHRYHEMVEAADFEDVMFADRFPFTYLVEDYGLHAHAAYVGCSAETEVSFETFARLTAELTELGLPGVVVIDDSDRRIADTVLAGSDDPNRTIVTLQSMQAVGTVDIRGGITYLEIMEENLLALERVLYKGAT